MENETHKTSEQNWDEFWKDIVTNPDGSINLEQLKKELSDFSQLIENTGIVYDYVTGGSISKVLTSPDIVKNIADNNYKFIYESELKAINEILDEFADTDSPCEFGLTVEKIIDKHLLAGSK